MNKDQLQKELLEKVKEGVKPSDLKKNQGKNTTPNIPTPPPPPRPKEQIKPISKEKTQQLEQENKLLKEKLSKLENQTKNTEKDKGNDKLFTCHTCQKSFDINFLRLVDKNNKKVCRSCLLKMLNRANQITGEEIVLRKKKKVEENRVSQNQSPTKTFTCQTCQQTQQGEPHQVHINNYQEQGINPRELAKVCANCLQEKVILANFYCPRTSEGRDTWNPNEPQFDCYCPIN